MKLNGNKIKELTPQHRKSSKYILAALLAVVFVLIVWIVCSVVNSFIKVKEISVEGESIYTAEQIIAASGMEIGSKRNKIDVGAVEDKLLGSMSFLADVDIKIKLNGKAVINITDEDISYYSNIAGSFYVMSSEFKLLGLSGDLVSRPNAIIIELPRIKKALVGSIVEFYEDTEYINVFVQSIDTSFISDSVTVIDVSDKYDLSVECGDKYIISFGDSKNLDKKMDRVQILTASTAIKDMPKVSIDVSDISNPTVKPLD